MFFEADILACAAEAEDEVAAGFIHFFSLHLAYVFNDYEAAAAKAGDMCHIFQPPYLHPTMSCRFTFHFLALLAVCNQQPWCTRRKKLSIARQPIKKLEKFSAHTPENCVGKMYLLQAELASATGKHDVARCKYASAVGVCSEFGDRMMCAIACVRELVFPFKDWAMRLRQIVTIERHTRRMRTGELLRRWSNWKRDCQSFL